MGFYQSWVIPILPTPTLLTPTGSGWFINLLLTVRRELKMTILEVAAL